MFISIVLQSAIHSQVLISLLFSKPEFIKASMLLPGPPELPTKYHANMDCSWTIQSPGNKPLQLTKDKLVLKAGDGDTLVVEDTDGIKWDQTKPTFDSNKPIKIKFTSLSASKKTSQMKLSWKLKPDAKQSSTPPSDPWNCKMFRFPASADLDQLNNSALTGETLFSFEGNTVKVGGGSAPVYESDTGLRMEFKVYNDKGKDHFYWNIK